VSPQRFVITVSEMPLVQSWTSSNNQLMIRERHVGPPYDNLQFPRKDSCKLRYQP